MPERFAYLEAEGRGRSPLMPRSPSAQNIQNHGMRVTSREVCNAADGRRALVWLALGVFDDSSGAWRPRP